jgi:dolichol-phosphate mannosyltransferase
MSESGRSAPTLTGRAETRNGLKGAELPSAPEPLVSVIIPTKEEAGNIVPLLARLDRVAGEVSLEVVFVDDSDDATPRTILEAAEGIAAPVTLVHREAEERAGGLATAVVAGMARARGTWVCVMDADLQHPPELIPQLVERAQRGDVDLVVASRHAQGGHADDFGPLRSLLSRGSTSLARIGFRRALQGVSDPMSGFFLVNPYVVDLQRLRPHGFKILLELLVRAPEMSKAEVPFVFGERNAGRSKASIEEAANYMLHLWRLRLNGGPFRFARFGIVGLTGLVVNTALLALLTESTHLYYVLSAIIATQGSTLWNFALTEWWVFKTQAPPRGRLGRLVRFALVNDVALVLRGPLLVLFTDGFHIMYLVSNVLSLFALTLLRFGIADSWIWATKRAVRRRLYDIHGIMSVASDVALPELERFSVDRLSEQPTIDVTIGQVVTKSRRAKIVELSRDRFTYDEGLGPRGFGVDITVSDSISIVASRLLRRSPHVLYTNVVEPVLRWSFAERGYALVHAACMASGDRAFLITARTDTGKTTTILKSLDSNPGLAFLSDDLTLLCPDGTVLTYPKPLTISRHTVSAVKAPLLSRKERLALVFQSRLHSKSGRSFAFFLSKHNLPVATINTIVQLLVPPPKYHVDRLVPGVLRVRQAQFEGLVVIQRGEDGQRVLDSDEAVQIVLDNCADAYGFPPYSHLERFLHDRSDLDLVSVESSVIRQVIAEKPATLLSSGSRDWYLRLPEIFGLPEVAASDTQGGGDLPAELADQILLTLPVAPILAPEPGAE